MNITFPILLLLFGGLTLWLLAESRLKWYLKAVCISVFCCFTVIFWLSIHTFLGWPAQENDMPEAMNVHWVIVKEPDKITGNAGRIFFLLESTEPPLIDSLLEFFSYSREDNEPRLFGMAYSRKLHEQIEKDLMPQLKKGQVVRGKLSKGEGSENGEGKEGKNGKSGSKNGLGDESQEQEWIFHILRPAQIQRKN